MMRRVILIWMLALACLHTMGKERCLLIGIGHYPSSTGWHEIGSVNDVKLLQKSMSAFSVQTLIDQEATHDGILASINRLFSEIERGDTVLIHFSCHGQQVLTKGKDEKDGLDEALIPYDARSKRSSSYHGENHLLDDELGVIINRFRKKLGEHGFLIVSLDACFSDSMNKGEKKSRNVVYRGGEEIFGANYITPDSLKKVQARRLLQDNVPLEYMEKASEIIVISACKSYQRNREISVKGVSYGPLSYAMALAFQHGGIADVKSWLDRVYDEMATKAFTQNPQIRTTLDYSFPEVNMDESVTESEEQSVAHPWYVYLAATILLIVLFGIIIWRMKIRKS